MVHKDRNGPDRQGQARQNGRAADWQGGDAAAVPGVADVAAIAGNGMVTLICLAIHDPLPWRSRFIEDQPMDAFRFDSLVRSLPLTRSRRTALGALLAGPVALLEWNRTQARHKRRRCRGKADDTRCKRNGRCLLGACNPQPHCLTHRRLCTIGGDDCCSGTCEPSPVFGSCSYSAPGGPCYDEFDCNADFTITVECVGYVCMSTSCPADSDFCMNAPSDACGSAGMCLRPLGGGDSRCGEQATGNSCGCTSHKDCASAYGAGAFCAEITGSLCPGCAGGASTFCAVPR